MYTRVVPFVIGGMPTFTKLSSIMKPWRNGDVVVVLMPHLYMDPVTSATLWSRWRKPSCFGVPSAFFDVSLYASLLGSSELFASASSARTYGTSAVWVTTES